MLKPLLAFCATCILGALLVLVTDGSCATMVTYKYMVLFTVIGGGVLTLGYALVALSIGLIIFFQLRNRKGWFASHRSRIRYFSILPLFVFPKQFASIPQQIFNVQKDRALCEKTTSDGLFVRSTALTHDEYGQLRTKLDLLPALPKDADSIDVVFSHDGFLPDFGLTVRIRGSAADSVLLRDDHWSIDTSGKWDRHFVFVYYDHDE